MIPFKDDNPTATLPIVTVSLIVVNVAFFLLSPLASGGLAAIVSAYGAVPVEMLSFSGAHMKNVFVSMFLHGGIFHVGGNMLYLWIFGNNIEDRLGHTRFLVFYLASGLVAAYAHAFAAPSSGVPMVGASGAVSGILGAYLLLYPRAKIHTIIFLGFFVDIVMLPAVAVIGFWAVVQFISGIASKGAAGVGGVAWFAHVGGFLFGLLTLRLWLPRRRAWK